MQNLHPTVDCVSACRIPGLAGTNKRGITLPLLLLSGICCAGSAGHGPLQADAMASELLQYPPRPLPQGACTCRIGWDKQRLAMDCPSPWASAAGTSKVSCGCRGSLACRHRVGYWCVDT
jgi:hypothetical protein